MDIDQEPTIKPSCWFTPIPQRLNPEWLAFVGESVPLQPVPPPIIVSLSRRTNAPVAVHAAASAVRAACAEYCGQVEGRYIESLG